MDEGEDDGEDDTKFVVEIGFNPLAEYTVMGLKNLEAGIRYMVIFTKTMLEAGAEAPEGGPPPPYVERAVQRDLEGKHRGNRR